MKKSGHFLISCVPGENPEPVTGLGAAEAMATESSEEGRKMEE